LLIVPIADAMIDHNKKRSKSKQRLVRKHATRFRRVMKGTEQQQRVDNRRNVGHKQGRWATGFEEMAIVALEKNYLTKMT
jgi:hypothetical protein